MVSTGLLWWLSSKESACNSGDARHAGSMPGSEKSRGGEHAQETWIQSLGREDSLEEEMATHSNIFTWEIPWTEEPGGLQSVGFQRIRHN